LISGTRSQLPDLANLCPEQNQVHPDGAPSACCSVEHIAGLASSGYETRNKTNLSEFKARK